MMWIPVIAIGGIVVLAAFAVGLIHVIAALSGWTRLARTFKTDAPPPGTAFRAQSFYGRGTSHYIGAVDMYVADGGLYLALVGRVFRIAHPPLLIPWGQLTEMSRTSNLVRLRVGSPELMQIRIPNVVWDARRAA
jgi:hypothetical protein